MYLDLEQHLQDLKDRWSPEADTVETARETFPDLKAFQDPDGSIRYCSVKATPYADRIDIKHDSAGLAYAVAFTIDKGVQVYADPPILYVGRYNPNGFGEIPDDKTYEPVKEAWGEDLAKQVRDYFNKHQPADW